MSVPDNSAHLTAHDQAAEVYRRARDLRERGALPDSAWTKAQAEWERACREFEREYRVDLAPK